MSIYYIILLTAAVLTNSLLIALLLNSKRRSVVTGFFVIFLTAINISGLPQLIITSFIDVIPSHYQSIAFETLDKISAFGYTTIPVIFLIFALAFISKLHYFYNYLFSLLIFIPMVAFLFLFWNTMLIEQHQFNKAIHTTWGYASPTGPLFSLFLLWFEGVMIFSISLVVRFYRTTIDLAKKRQAFWIIVAVLIPLIVGTITDGILPIYSIYLFPAAVPLTSIMALMIAYAIYKYELFELSPIAILTNLGNGVITIDKSAKITLFNNSAAELLGIKKEDAVGKLLYKVWVLLDEEGKVVPIKQRPAVRSLKTGEKFVVDNFSVVIKGKHKRIFPISLTVNPILFNKEVVGATVIFRDITAEKELEKNKDAFISTASHELKTPITSMKLFNQILQERFKKYHSDKKISLYIEKLNEQLNNLTRLTTDLLDVSRIQTGKIDLKKESTDVNILIKDTIENIQRIVKSHKINLEGRCDKKVFIDKERITQVLTNLINNAIRYSPRAKQIIVTVSPNDEELKICVKDFGMGISNEDQTKIFERFYRIQQDKSAGMGLGLYISSEIIKAHQGNIWVESKVKKGSTFCFSLPFKA